MTDYQPFVWFEDRQREDGRRLFITPNQLQAEPGIGPAMSDADCLSDELRVCLRLHRITEDNRIRASVHAGDESGRIRLVWNGRTLADRDYEDAA